MENQLVELRHLASIARNRRTETGIPRVAMVQGAIPEHELAAVYDPMINIILTGSKAMTIGERTMRYDPASYFVMSLDLPAVGEVCPDAVGNPYLAVSLTIDPQMVGMLLADLGHVAPPPCSSGFSVATVTPELLDAWLRMLRLIDNPTDIAALAPAYEREILYRVLQGPHGAMLRDIAMPDTAISRVRLAIHWIRTNFKLPLRVEALAEIAAMSASAFHRHFKAATAMSPLQFQKRIRLLQARMLLIASAQSIAAVAYEVGYESQSQFTREYTRFFGQPPARDVRRVQRELRDGLA
ncbi:AraC family transcriptional regulator [Gluconobacter japonicus]|uniref:AraC family transcriptional regulator n=1 Tax=Gluconobacter japonicus TaxID=376620 RepID=A0A9Q2IX33_GLUJA|nr:AraC family transcriptional regulator [Gluconobacter japonicus]MBF0871562.1 AraC family transcriptional regulator [Gluconobacter japonicus]